MRRSRCQGGVWRSNASVAVAAGQHSIGSQGCRIQVCTGSHLVKELTGIWKKTRLFLGAEEEKLQMRVAVLLIQGEVQLRSGKCSNHGSSSAGGSLKPECVPSSLLGAWLKCPVGRLCPSIQIQSLMRSSIFVLILMAYPMPKFSGLVVDQPLDSLHRACIQLIHTFPELLCLPCCTLKYLLYWAFWRGWFFHLCWFPS